MQNLYQSKLRHWWWKYEYMCTYDGYSDVIAVPFGTVGLPQFQLLLTARRPGGSPAPQNPWLRLYPPPRSSSWPPGTSQCEGVSKHLVPWVNWDNPEDPSSSRASLESPGRPGPVMAHLLCLLPFLHSPTAVHSQAILPHTFLPANLHFSLFPRKLSLKPRTLKIIRYRKKKNVLWDVLWSFVNKNNILPHFLSTYNQGTVSAKHLTDLDLLNAHNLHQADPIPCQACVKMRN